MIVRSVIYALFAVGILALAIPKYAISQRFTTACYQGHCIPTTADRYNRCVDLALRRGQNLSKGDRRLRCLRAGVRGRPSNKVTATPSEDDDDVPTGACGYFSVPVPNTNEDRRTI